VDPAKIRSWVPRKLARGSRKTVDLSINLTLWSSLDTVQTEVAVNACGSLRN